MPELRIGLVGAGIIGLTHIETINKTPGFSLAGIVDPGPGGAVAARDHSVPLYVDVGKMIASGAIDGAIVAAPNELHVPLSTQFLEAGIPVLLEKPIANTLDEAAQLLGVSERTRVPLLVGHHRRHNPIIRKARALIEDGTLGQLITATVMCTLYKDDDYFNIPWRKAPGVGGPLLINLIHEIDLLRYLFGDIASVTAVSSNKARGFEVEDTAAVTLRFENGGLASLAISDAAVGPWAWDLSAGENLGRFPAHKIQSHFFAGSEGGLTLPDLVLWTHEGEKRWNKEINSASAAVEREDVYKAQLEHFGAVIKGTAKPVVSGLDATKNLATIIAILQAAKTGRETDVDTGWQSKSVAGAVENGH